MTTRTLLLIPALLLAVSTACFQENDLSGTDWPPDGPLDDDDVLNTDGPQPDIKLDPETLGFGYLLPDCPSDPKTVTVTNVGDAPLEIYDIAKTGPSQAAFTYNGPSAPQTLAVGDSFTFTVNFEAAAIADYEGYITFESNDPDESITDVDLVGHGSDSPRAEDIFVQPIPEGVDVLWVLDNSCSMGDVIDRLTLELDTFVNSFATLGLDYQLGVTTTDMTSAGHAGELQGVGVMSPGLLGGDAAVITAFSGAVDDAFNTGGSGTEQGRDGAYAALTAPLITGVNSGMLRTDAHLAIIVVSDEEDQSDIDRNTFVNWLDGLKGDPDRTSFSAMSGKEQTTPSGFGFPDITCAFSGGGTAEGTYEYPYVTNATDGLYTELCNMDFAEVLLWLSYSAAGLSSEFCLTETPLNQFQIQAAVDSTSVNYSPIDGWTYDAASNCITFHGASIPGPDGVVTVSYPVDGGC